MKIVEWAAVESAFPAWSVLTPRMSSGQYLLLQILQCTPFLPAAVPKLPLGLGSTCSVDEIHGFPNVRFVY